MLGLRSLRAATTVARTTNVPSVAAVQQLRFGAHLPKYLKGKLYWKRRDLRGKKDPDREKKERDLRALRVASTQFNWKPQTGIKLAKYLTRQKLKKCTKKLFWSAIKQQKDMVLERYTSYSI